jgi:hypothetical protein
MPTEINISCFRVIIWFIYSQTYSNVGWSSSAPFTCPLIRYSRLELTNLRLVTLIHEYCTPLLRLRQSSFNCGIPQTGSLQFGSAKLLLTLASTAILHSGSRRNNNHSFCPTALGVVQLLSLSLFRISATVLCTLFFTTAPRLSEWNRRFPLLAEPKNWGVGQVWKLRRPCSGIWWHVNRIHTLSFQRTVSATIYTYVGLYVSPYTNLVKFHWQHTSVLLSVSSLCATNKSIIPFLKIHTS